MIFGIENCYNYDVDKKLFSAYLCYSGSGKYKF